MLKQVEAHHILMIFDVNYIFFCRLGPMVRTWCMRFEAKHERLKRLASILGNFTNVPWTLTNRHQQRQCYEMACSKYGQPFIEKPIEIGQGTSKWIF